MSVGTGCGVDADADVLCDTQTLKIVSQSMGHSGRALGVRWSPDEKQVVTVGTDCCIAVWNFYGV